MIDRSLCEKDCPSVPWLTFLYDGIGYFRSTPSSPSTPLSSRIPLSLLPPLQQDTARPRNRMERTRSIPPEESESSSSEAPPSLRRRAVAASSVKRPFALSGAVHVAYGRDNRVENGRGRRHSRIRGRIEIVLMQLVRPRPIVGIMRDILSRGEKEKETTGCP